MGRVGREQVTAAIGVLKEKAGLRLAGAARCPGARYRARAVMVVAAAFTPTPNVTYTVYRQAYEQERSAVVVGWVTTDAQGRIVPGSEAPAGVWRDDDPVFPRMLVFTDADLVVDSNRGITGLDVSDPTAPSCLAGCHSAPVTPYTWSPLY